eukprot:CAMPEP_0197599044 /NCGR_PEP_ID=MMETSP1326-20131121/30568_1 /TAXON_ID=1155430 /ORGANISM="Genus nov. species nov., Strain RCC2288" /LENGTH=77 /DNA_ID=CAMNT_0043165943 /DNA_START=33 /DNA_END=262 /DNA_ORIENTATION=+
MTPSGASASAAALLHAPPAGHVDSMASSQVEGLLAHDALSRPGAVLNIHLAGVPAEALAGAAGAAAHSAGAGAGAGA